MIPRIFQLYMKYKFLCSAFYFRIITSCPSSHWQPETTTGVQCVCNNSFSPLQAGTRILRCGPGLSSPVSPSSSQLTENDYFSNRVRYFSLLLSVESKDLINLKLCVCPHHLSWRHQARYGVRGEWGSVEQQRAHTLGLHWRPGVNRDYANLGLL